MGDGAVARAYGFAHLITPIAMKSEIAACRFPVIDFGPRRVDQGVPFYDQGDGRSTLWIKLSGPAQGLIRLRMGQDEAEVLVVGNKASAQFPPDGSLQVPGIHSVEWICDTGAAVPFGELEVVARSQKE